MGEPIVRKPKHKLDLRISKEVTQAFVSELREALATTIKESHSWPYPDVEAAAFPYQYLDDVLLSKYVDKGTDSPDVRRARAIEKWLGVELLNRRTNRRLFETDPYFDGIGYGWEILRLAARLIRGVIGTTVPEGLLLKGSFTGGATTSRKRGMDTVARKFIGVLDATPRCFAAFAEQANPDSVAGWSYYQPELHSPRLVRGNVLFTVPKTAVIDRVACKEPDLNIFCQKAVGDFLRRRLLKRVRINLNDQTINRELARTGSIDGSLSTIDLSSASDSLTTGLVSVLLPLEWFRLLDDLRSPKTFIGRMSHTNEMFSSMGNGFTFELESMVFWALAQATCRLSRTSGRVSVYGDDIIVPAGISRAFLNVLRWCGFKPNVDKTFCLGPFRESCGGHYHRGLDVTPFYLRRPLKDVSDLILLLNQYRAWIIRTESDVIGGAYECQNRFTRIWYKYAKLVPKPLWGGFSLESRTQLASKGPKQCELFMPTLRWTWVEDECQTGMYLSRLSELDRRGSSPLQSSASAAFRSDTGLWQMRRAKIEPTVFGLVRPLFWFEQNR